MPRAILADDERMMRDQLRLRLSQVWPELEIVAEGKNGQEAVDLVREHKPDLAFLDIRMPGLTGIEAAGQIGNACHVVFVTAYDQYAVEAFDQGAVDYVLKPADPERLGKTVERIKSRLNAAPADLQALVAQLAGRMGLNVTAVSQPASAPVALEADATTADINQVADTPGKSLEWIQASVGQTIRMIPVDEVLFFMSDEKYTRVQTATIEALIKKPLKDLIAQLNPKHFWQIHRSTVVNVREIAGISRDFRGHLIIQLKNHAEKLEVSRSYTHLFKGM